MRTNQSVQIELLPIDALPFRFHALTNLGRTACAPSNQSFAPFQSFRLQNRPNTPWRVRSQRGPSQVTQSVQRR